MSVLAIVTDLSEVRSVVAAAKYSARAMNTALIVLCYEYCPIAEAAQRVHCTDTEQQELVVHTFQVLDRLRTDGDDEESPGDWETVQLVRHPNALTTTLEHTRSQSADLVIAAAESTNPMPGRASFQSQLLRHVSCNVWLVSIRSDRVFGSNRILAVATDSADDRSLVAGANRLALTHQGQLTVAVVEAGAGRQTKELGQRQLKSVLKGAGVTKRDHVRTKVLQADQLVGGVASIADDYDVVILGSGHLSELPQLVNSTEHATISVFRRAPPIRAWRSRQPLLNFVPALAPADYADLVQNLRTGSQWSSDFRIMLGLAVGIASLGLLLNSAAVIIGSMLLAPLMTPMVGMGLALVQGNTRLALKCVSSLGLGILLALAISFAIGLALPGDALTPELTGRGSPNVMDLLIALLSAAAGAYALARPTLAGSIAGVAIATALVPPLCTVGISLADHHFENAAGAAMLFVTNFLAIVMAAAGMFHWMGLGIGEAGDPVRRNRWVRRVLVGMFLATLVLMFPLSRGLVSRLRKGVSQIPATPLSQATYESVQTQIARHPGVSLVFALRRPSSLDRPADFRIVVASESPLPRSFAAEVVDAVRTEMADEAVQVDVIAVPLNWMSAEERANPQ